MPTVGPIFDFVEGDTLSKLTVTFVDDDGTTAIDLTSGTVEFILVTREDGILSVPQTVAATLVNPPSGVAEYQFADGDLRPGTLFVEARALLNTGRVISSKSVTEFSVRGKLNR